MPIVEAQHVTEDVTKYIDRAGPCLLTYDRPVRCHTSNLSYTYEAYHEVYGCDGYIEARSRPIFAW